MTIEELEILASYLHNEATDPAFPHHAGRKEWMAQRITYAITEDNYLLNQLMACETTDQVLDLLGTQYRRQTLRTDQE